MQLSDSWQLSTCKTGKGVWYCSRIPHTCRQDPSLLDWHGKTAKGPHDGKDKGQIAGREFKFYKKSEAVNRLGWKSGGCIGTPKMFWSVI